MEQISEKDQVQQIIAERITFNNIFPVSSRKTITVKIENQNTKEIIHMKWETDAEINFKRMK